MKKILITKFPYSSTFGGGERHTLTLVEQLQKQGYQFYLLSTCSVLKKEFKKRQWFVRTAWAGTEPVTPGALIVFFFTAPFIWLNLFFKLLYYRKQYQITTLVCLSLTEKILLTPWAYWLGIKVIWLEHLQIERWLLASPLKYGYKLFSRYATIITVVEAVKQQLIKLGLAAKQIKVIYNSVDVTQFLPQPVLSVTTEREQSFEVLFVGRLATEKGIDDLIKAVSLLILKIPNIHLNVVGEGYWQPGLEQLVNKLNLQKYITFVGFQTDIKPWLYLSHVLVLPAIRRETFGIILAEALACAKPVVATRVGGLPEVVGNCGWLVPAQQPVAIAEALLDVYKHYPVALERAKQGRQRVLELFSEERMIQAYAQVLV
ncbi:MAG: glycosyltransferase family 4 protein [Patescibacteria group bacterium]|jgi:glycosyltransferase involved in cell wall biosynthesis